MNQMLVKLLLFAILLVTLAETQDYSKMTREQKKQLAKSILGSMGTKSSVISCTKTGCATGLVCVGGTWGCAIPEGGKCTPVKDKCQGRYYCSGSGICNGSGKGKLNDKCESTVQCDGGFYCDQKALRCLKVTGESMCTKNADCKYKCYTGDCVCSGSTCTDR